MPPDAVLATLRHVWVALEAGKIPVALAGGLAMIAWGRARFTRDVDLLVAVGEPMLKEVVKRLQAVGVRTQAPVVRVGESRFIQLLFEPPGALTEIQIDLILATTDFHREAIERRVSLNPSLLGFQAEVVTCEDLIILKLVAGRILDRVDVGELLKENRTLLDMDYVARWVFKLGLQRAFREAWVDQLSSEPPPF